MTYPVRIITTRTATHLLATDLGDAVETACGRRVRIEGYSQGLKGTHESGSLRASINCAACRRTHQYAGTLQRLGQSEDTTVSTAAVTGARAAVPA